MYFDSKYVEDIRNETNDGVNADPEVLWKYLSITEGDVDNLEHLLGSSRRMLDDRPDNPVFILMQCFAIYLLETNVVNGELEIKNDNLIEKATSDFVEGISRFETDGFDVEEILTAFKGEVLKHNSALASFISTREEEIWLKIHVNWIDKFNSKFDNYE